MLLDKKISAICQIASKEPGRPILQSVQLQGGKATATDGYRLMQVDLPQWDKYQEELPAIGHKPIDAKDESYLIMAAELKKALDAIPNKTSLPILEHAWTAKGSLEKTVKIVSTNLETINAPEIRLTEGNYPEYAKIIPTEKPITEVSVNAKLLSELLAAMVKAGAREPNYVVKITIYGKEKAIRLDAQDEEKRSIMGLIMPVKAE